MINGFIAKKMLQNWLFAKTVDYLQNKFVADIESCLCDKSNVDYYALYLKNLIFVFVEKGKFQNISLSIFFKLQTVLAIFRYCSENAKFVKVVPVVYLHNIKHSKNALSQKVFILPFLCSVVRNVKRFKVRSGVYLHLTYQILSNILP